MFVWRGDQEHAVGFEHSLDLQDKTLLSTHVDVLDRLERGDDVEEFLALQRQDVRAAPKEAHVPARVADARVCDRLLADIHADDPFGPASQPTTTVAFPAGDIENRLALDKTIREQVSMPVFVGDLGP